MKLLFFWCMPAMAMGYDYEEESQVRGVQDFGASFAVAMADVNLDGHVDIFLTNAGTTNRLWLNKGDGSGTFVDNTDAAGVADAEGSSRGAAFADVNGDGFLDLYVNDAEDSNHLYQGNGNGTFVDITVASKVGDTGMGQGVCFADVDNDGDLDLFVVNFDRSNNLYLNDGRGVFTNVTAKSGLDSTGNNGFGCAFADFDEDGDVDLYVSNDGSINRLYLNDGKGVFSVTGATEGEEAAGDDGKGRGVSVGDLNGDGHLDIYVVSPLTKNYLFLGDGSGGFSDASDASGAGDTGAAQGVNIADVDGDGDLDIFVANILSPCSLYENTGNGIFKDVAHSAGLDYHIFGQGVSFGDIDNDGDLDIYINSWGTPPSGWPKQGNRFLINHQSINGWLKVRPADPISARATMIGTQVRVFEAGTRNVAGVPIMQIDGGSGFASQNAYDAYFGLLQWVGTGKTFDVEMKCNNTWVTKDIIPQLGNVEINTQYQFPCPMDTAVLKSIV